MVIATDPFSLLFIVCFLGGLLFLVVTALMGTLIHGHGITAHHHIGAGHAHVHGAHIHHAGNHAGNSTVRGGHATGTKGARAGNGMPAIFAFLNPTMLVIFLIGFGFFGYVFHNSTQLALPLTLVLAAISGFIIAGVLLALLNRAFGDSEGATVQDVVDRTGLLGKVTLTIPENGLGEVLYVSPGGMRKSIPARSIDGHRLERDQEVVVVNYQGGIAEVDTWEHFINQEVANGNTLPESDELETLQALLEEPNKADAEYSIRKDASKE